MRWPGALTVHRLAVELARETDREVADVDHLLDFTLALGEDLAHLEGDERPSSAFFCAQRFADLAHDLTSLGRRQSCARS